MVERGQIAWIDAVDLDEGESLTLLGDPLLVQ